MRKMSDDDLTDYRDVIHPTEVNDDKESPPTLVHATHGEDEPAPLNTEATSKLIPWTYDAREIADLLPAQAYSPSTGDPVQVSTVTEAKLHDGSVWYVCGIQGCNRGRFGGPYVAASVQSVVSHQGVHRAKKNKSGDARAYDHPAKTDDQPSSLAEIPKGQRGRYAENAVLAWFQAHPDTPISSRNLSELLGLPYHLGQLGISNLNTGRSPLSNRTIRKHLERYYAEGESVWIWRSDNGRRPQPRKSVGAAHRRQSVDFGLPGGGFPVTDEEESNEPDDAPALARAAAARQEKSSLAADLNERRRDWNAFDEVLASSLDADERQQQRAHGTYMPQVPPAKPSVEQVQHREYGIQPDLPPVVQEALSWVQVGTLQDGSVVLSHDGKLYRTVAL